MSHKQTKDKKTQATEVKVKAFPFTTRKVRSSLGAPILMTFGIASAAIGGLWAFAPEMITGFSGFLETLESGQIAAGDLMVGGLLCFAMGMIGRYPRVMAKSMLDLNQTDQAVTELGADMVEVSNMMQEVRDDQLQARSEVHALSAKIREWRTSDKSGEANDALYRLAASLDQVHAQIDRRLGAVTQEIEGRIAEVFQLVEASRDFLQESIEENTDRAERIERNVGEVLEAVAAIEIPAGAETLEDGELIAPTYESLDPFAEPESDADDDEFEMTITVDFEPEDAPKVAAPELGLLDDVSDDPGMWEEEAEAARHKEATDEHKPVSGLNLLDDPMTEDTDASATHSEDKEPAAPLPCEASSESPAPERHVSEASSETSVPHAIPMTGPVSEPRAPLPKPAPDVRFEAPPFEAQTQDVTEIDLDAPPPFPGPGSAPQPPNYPR